MQVPGVSIFVVLLLLVGDAVHLAGRSGSLSATPRAQSAAATSAGPDDIITITNWHARLGNNILQISNAITYAQFMNESRLKVPLIDEQVGPQIWDLSGEVAVQPNDYYPRPKRLPCHGNFGRRDSFYECSDVSKKVMRETLLRHLAPALTPATKKACQKESEHPFDGLTIHLRSGDIQHVNGVHGIFAPCRFFEKVIADHSFDSVRIVTEPDLAHPCIPVMEDFKRKGMLRSVEIQSRSVEEDACAIMHARNLAVGSYSTFPESLVLLNTRIQSVFRSVPPPRRYHAGPRCRERLDLSDHGAVSTYIYEIADMANVLDLADRAGYFEHFPLEKISWKHTCYWDADEYDFLRRVEKRWGVAVAGVKHED